MKKLMALLLVAVLVCSFAACTANSTTPASAGADTGTTAPATTTKATTPPTTKAPETTAPPMSRIAKMLDQESDVFDIEITYSEIARQPDDYSGQLVAYNGQVVQIMKGDGFTAMRIAVDGDSNQMLYCEYTGESDTVKMLEDDWITLYGECLGEYSYESVMGATITLPAILICRTVEYDHSVKIEYDPGPFTFQQNTYSGKRSTEIESFEIIKAEQAYSTSANLTVDYVIIGTVKGYGYMDIDVKCYDSEGFLIDTASIFASVSDGERFKLTDNFYAPLGTVRIEFSME